MTQATKQVSKRSGLVSSSIQTKPGLSASGKDVTGAAARLPTFGFPKSIGPDGKPFKAQLDLIDDSPYQTSPLNQVKVNELVENFKGNELSSPIVLRGKSNGRFELIAGRHRVAAFRVLGRTEIDSTLREVDDDQAERLVFYDNLFGPNLNDYAKYLGFARRKTTKKLTDELLAEESGLSRSQVTKLMSFECFSPKAHHVLAQHPDAIGATAALPLAKLCETKEDLVISAIKKVAAGLLQQKDALRWIEAGGDIKVSPAKFDGIEVSIKSGKAMYAKFERRNARVTINFSSVAEASALQSAITKLLKERAASLK